MKDFIWAMTLVQNREQNTRKTHSSIETKLHGR